MANFATIFKRHNTSRFEIIVLHFIARLMIKIFLLTVQIQRQNEIIVEKNKNIISSVKRYNYKVKKNVSEAFKTDRIKILYLL